MKWFAVAVALLLGGASAGCEITSPCVPQDFDRVERPQGEDYPPEVAAYLAEHPRASCVLAPVQPIGPRLESWRCSCP